MFPSFLKPQCSWKITGLVTRPQWSPGRAKLLPLALTSRWFPKHRVVEKVGFDLLNMILFNMFKNIKNDDLRSQLPLILHQRRFLADFKNMLQQILSIVVSMRTINQRNWELTPSEHSQHISQKWVCLKNQRNNPKIHWFMVNPILPHGPFYRHFGSKEMNSRSNYSDTRKDNMPLGSQKKHLDLSGVGNCPILGILDITL